MFLFVDTETTGLPSYRNAPATDVDAWPHIVQLAWIRADRFGQELEARSHLIRPDGYTIPADATKVHGITTARARSRGIPIRTALKQLRQSAADAQVLVAHNLDFDRPVIESAYHRTGRQGSPLASLRQLCTMKAASRQFGRWPTLASLVTTVLGEAHTDTHEALADARACMRVFFQLWRDELISVPGPSLSEYDEADHEEDESLFEAIYDAAAESSWFDTSVFVDSVYEQFVQKQFISERQREALNRILDKLEA